jgi:carbohydrate-binding DOMON domain-containing protein
MMKKFAQLAALVAVTSLSLLTAATPQEVALQDPTGDDNGPGTYSYPTDTVYKQGSFDLTGLALKVKGDKATVEVTVNSNLEDPWRMGVGFSVQMVFVFIDVDGKEGSGFTKGLPGTNVTFAPKDAWDKCIVLSPQAPGRVRNEVDTKAGPMKSAIVIPSRTRGSSRTISASVDLKDLGSGDPSTWGYQVVMQSNEGFPSDNDLLTRKVNEYEGQHRFGGGNDGECDPHAMDVLAGKGAGDKSEIDAQKQMLRYECNADGTAKTMAVLGMVRK